MILLVIILIFIICIIILYKQHTVENLGTFVQIIDYDLINKGGINNTCKIENIACNKINSKYINKKNYDNILCLTNCTDDESKLKTCCDRKAYCNDSIGLCEGAPFISEAQNTECTDNICTKQQCCDTENTLESTYTEYNNYLLQDNGTLNDILDLKITESTYKNNDNYCKAACSSNEIPNCLGFLVNKPRNECSLFNTVGNNGKIVHDVEEKHKIFIKNKFKYLFNIKKKL